MNKGHTVRECQIAEHKLEAVRQQNLAKMMATEGPQGAAVRSTHEEEMEAASYLAKLDQMHQSFENLNTEVLDFQ